MVSVDKGFVRVAYKVWSPSQEGMDDGKKFFVIDVPVSLCSIESLGKESDGVEFAFLIPLLKDGADSIGGGVAIDCELIFESGLLEDGGSADGVHKGVECGLVFVIPIELPSLRTVSDECVERCGQHAKSTDIHAIKV